MADSTPNLMTADQFNESVTKWTRVVRGKMRGNVQSSTSSGSESKWKGRTAKKLANSISYRLAKDFEAIQRVTFSFERHGVFLHYGVGRGYVRSGSSISRGFIVKPKVKVSRSGPIKRKPVDWFEVEIKTGIKQLADVAQEYYGDAVMREILQKQNKSLIEK